jgi:hypothetical protein
MIRSYAVSLACAVHFWTDIERVKETASTAFSLVLPVLTFSLVATPKCVSEGKARLQG